ncbi:MAG TPA: sel1 repeat family protein [Ignavibacteria bacterium]|nr:sel1 repeat family protein [Ignavibacteria bacterium]
MIKIIRISNIYFLLPLILILSSQLKAQDTTESLAFKNYRPKVRQRLFYRPNLAYQIWQHFKLVQDANKGNTLAQHELGLRYLLGKGFSTDTVKAAYWIKKAADKGLAAASYNYGILLNNGWGTKWNPFSAFNYFMIAAKDGMPQAEQVVGLIYTDNLVVKRNWSKAYKWIKEAAKQKYKPAEIILAEFRKKINISSLDTTSVKGNKKNHLFTSSNNSMNTSLSSTLGLVYIDFHTITDTSSKIDNKLLLEDILHPGNEKLAKTLKLTTKNDSSFSFDSTSLALLKKFANNGSPEALTLLGRLYEKGFHFKKDILKAAVYYVRAIKLDSPRSFRLLWNLIKENNFYKALQELAKKKNPAALFTWYGLHIFGFDNNIVDEDAFNLLVQSANSNFIPALNELGLDYFTGKIVKQNKEKAITIWKKAERLGSAGAKIRLIISNIFDDSLKNKILATSIKGLKKAITDGSVLAQATLAYCYEYGIGVSKNIPDAVKYYRFATERGSQYAYNQLRKLYNSVRPSGKEFIIN